MERDFKTALTMFQRPIFFDGTIRNYKIVGYKVPVLAGFWPKGSETVLECSETAKNIAREIMDGPVPYGNFSLDELIETVERNYMPNILLEYSIFEAVNGECLDDYDLPINLDEYEKYDEIDFQLNRYFLMELEQLPIESRQYLERKIDENQSHLVFHIDCKFSFAYHASYP